MSDKMERPKDLDNAAADTDTYPWKLNEVDFARWAQQLEAEKAELETRIEQARFEMVQMQVDDRMSLSAKRQLDHTLLGEDSDA